jgi:glucosamine-6-phosphate deaminase
MQLLRFDSKAALGARAAADGADALRATLARDGHATIIVATGMSQFEMLENLVRSEGIDWTRVTAFHLDEYVGLPESHPASFRRYLRERFVERLPAPLAAFHAIDGDTGDPRAECDRLAALIADRSVCVAFIGIGENGHIAFNDPPADFETTDPYLVVALDDACRNQQLGEGWFPTFESVPTHAISMSVRQILRSAHIVCSVPDARKVDAVKNTVEGPITPDVPASILQRHRNTTLYLDIPSAANLSTPVTDA